MMIPLLKYIRSKDEKYIKETALFMSITEDVLDSDTLDILKKTALNMSKPKLECLQICIKGQLSILETGIT